MLEMVSREETQAEMELEEEAEAVVPVEFTQCGFETANKLPPTFKFFCLIDYFEIFSFFHSFFLPFFSFGYQYDL